MEYHNPDKVGHGERCRVIWEGGFLVENDVSVVWTPVATLGGPDVRVPEHTASLRVNNPDKVWIQSLDSDKVKERIRKELNHDAILLQERVDTAEKMIQDLRYQIQKMRVGYEASQLLWKDKHKDKPWLVDARVEDLPAAIERGEPEPDPLDWWG